jgi:hypothetical protein
VLARIEIAATNAGYGGQADRLDLQFWPLRSSITNAVFDDRKNVRITDIEADGIAIELHIVADSGSTPATTPRRFHRLPSTGWRFVMNRSHVDRGRTIRIPSWSLDLQNGGCTLHISDPVKLCPDIEVSLPELSIAYVDRLLRLGPSDWLVRLTDATITGRADLQSPIKRFQHRFGKRLCLNRQFEVQMRSR